MAHFSSNSISIQCSGYNILVFDNVSQNLPRIITQNCPSPLYVIITDQNVENLYGTSLKNQFVSLNYKTLLFSIPPGEISKSKKMKSKIEDWMVRNMCNRDTVIISLGGGVVGDLSGFVASTFMRGIRYVHVPTTLLSCADSSIGGKTGINTKHGKNLIGSFYNPILVIVNLFFLSSLSQREFCNGISEIIKISFVLDKPLFECLEENKNTLMESNFGIEKNKILKDVIIRAITLKSKIVQEDHKENSKRKILNFGHTVGHAIEHLFGQKYLHGDCVAMGMVYECLIAVEMGVMESYATYRRLIALLEELKLPTKLGRNQESWEDLIRKIIQRVFRDKKRNEMECDLKVKMVLVSDLGKVCKKVVTEVDPAVLEKSLCPFYSFGTKEIEGAKSKEIVTVKIPGSKSITNRALLLAALGKGQCTIKNILVSEDTQVMICCLQKLGVNVAWKDPSTVIVTGCGGVFKEDGPVQLNVINSGTTARFLLSVCASCGNNDITITGSRRLKERPISDLIKTLRENGCKILCTEKENCFPLTVVPNSQRTEIKSLKTKNRGLKGGILQINGEESSQFASSLLISAPFADSKETLIEILKPGRNKENKEITSSQYVEMTVEMLKEFGVSVTKINNKKFIVRKMVYQNPSEFIVESDATSATYFLGMAAATGKTVRVENFPTSGKQGDEQFKEVLKKMGCEIKIVSISENQSQKEGKRNFLECKGPPLHKLKSVGEIDMSKMTDAFVTLSALAAISEGETVIFNIANQRKKECNRIEAVVSSLMRLGGDARETESGLVIKGDPSFKSLSGEIVSCKSDHRIAMGFSILSALIKDVIIEDKFCVEKTFPGYFNQIERAFGFTFHPKTIITASKYLKTPQFSLYDSTLVVIGMRGVGKTTLCKRVSENINVPFFDMDSYFENSFHTKIKKFVEKKGIKEFRKKEFEVFKKVLKEKPTLRFSTKDGYDGPFRIIACGGGIVENAHFVNFATAKLPFVVFLRRKIGKVIENLAGIPEGFEDNDKKERLNLNEHPLDTWFRRKRRYLMASKYDFFATEDIEEDVKNFSEFFQRLFRAQIQPFERKIRFKKSFFVCLTLPDYEDKEELIKKTVKGANAVEIRIDMLSIKSEENVAKQVYYLMRSTDLPLIFTVLCKDKGGKFPQNEKLYTNLIRSGLRSGCEIVSIEMDKKGMMIKDLLEHKPIYTTVISSYHYPDGLTKETRLKENYENVLVELCNTSKIVKIVANTKTVKEAIKFASVTKKFSKRVKNKNLLIAVDRGVFGSVSRITNRVLAPVTHQELSTPAAKGQLSIESLCALRSEKRGPKRVLLFGSDIEKSLSPQIHNFVYESLGMCFEYRLCQVQSLDSVLKEVGRKGFRAANVTMPYKERILPYLERISSDAETIGAVNTIIKKHNKGNKIYGYNTDWQGIKNCLSSVPLVQTMLRDPLKIRKSKGLILGAGGTARAAIYALKQLGINGRNIFVSNRTIEKAVFLSEKFGCEFLKDLKEFVNEDTNNEVLIMVVAVPDAANLKLSEKVSKHPNLVLVEMNYTPEVTKVMKQVSPLHPSRLVTGLEILVEQAIRAIEIISGRVIDIKRENVIDYLKSKNN